MQVSPVQQEKQANISRLQQELSRARAQREKILKQVEEAKKQGIWHPRSDLALSRNYWNKRISKLQEAIRIQKGADVAYTYESLKDYIEKSTKLEVKSAWEAEAQRRIELKRAAKSEKKETLAKKLEPVPAKKPVSVKDYKPTVVGYDMWGRPLYASVAKPTAEQVFMTRVEEVMRKRRKPELKMTVKPEEKYKGKYVGKFKEFTVGEKLESQFIKLQQKHLAVGEWIGEKVSTLASALPYFSFKRGREGFFSKPPPYKPVLSVFSDTGIIHPKKETIQVRSRTREEIWKSNPEAAAELELAEKVAEEKDKISSVSESVSKKLLNKYQLAVNRNEMSLEEARQKYQEEYAEIMSSSVEEANKRIKEYRESLFEKAQKILDKREALPMAAGSLLTGLGYGAVAVLAPPVGAVIAGLSLFGAYVKRKEIKKFARERPISFAASVGGGLIGSYVGARCS